MTSIHVSDLSKVIRSYKSDFSRFLNWFGVYAPPITEKWILNEVNFKIGSGESIAIVGHNGAGKSTLLKLLSGAMRATKGQIKSEGTISAIIELGLGFDINQTGRSNAYIYSNLVNRTKEQVDEVIGEIADFAEIGDYFDKPIRTYSTGMQMRLAFAIATAFRPDILIIDEALSVGDSYFQHKSFGRIKKFREAGTTLIFVSHDRNAVLALCERAIVLEDGKLILDGDAKTVLDTYNQRISLSDSEKANSPGVQTAKSVQAGDSGNGAVSIEYVTLLDHNGQAVDTVSVGEKVLLECCAAVNEDIERLVFGYSIRDRLGITLFGTNTYHTDQVIYGLTERKHLKYQAEFEIMLGPGSYSIQVAFHDADTHLNANYAWIDFALSFSVVNKDKTIFIGSMWNEPKFSIAEYDD